MTRYDAQVASYNSTTLELTELLRATHSLKKMFVNVEVIGAPDFNDLNGWVKTLGIIVYFCMTYWSVRDW